MGGVSQIVTYATVSCTCSVLMGPNRACAKVTQELLLFILLKTRQLLLHVPDKELQCCYEERDGVILFL